MRVEHIGEATLYLGDCLEILPTLGKVDAVVTDPPYGIGIEYGESFEDDVNYIGHIVADILPQLKSIALRVALFPGIRNTWLYPEPDWIAAHVWKTTGCIGGYGFQQWQPIFLYGKDTEGGLSSREGVLKSDVLLFEGGGGTGLLKEIVDHPCSKPLNVMERMVSRFSLDTEIILDPFMGSGTTGVACANLGRKFIGIEIEPKYFDIACRRIEDAYKQPRLFDDDPRKYKEIDMFEADK